MIKDEVLWMSPHGHGLTPKTWQQILDDLMNRRRFIDERTGCWIDLGTQASPKGYTKLYFNRRWILTTHFILDVVKNITIPNGKLVCHICDNPPCFNPDHLFLGTNHENMQDMIQKGRAFHPNGEALPHKITESDVRRIRQEYAQGNISFSLLGEKYGISKTQTRAIVRFFKWKHIK